MSTAQKELYDMILNIPDSEMPKIKQLLRIFIADDYATTEELNAIKAGEEQIATGDFVTIDELKAVKK
ncbi:MAG: hypothetical protein LBM38_03090 [Clostridiales bacterium]|jgi:hypothetical protein|nr:hypothetical protein [Clostridiales bacterium]